MPVDFIAEIEVEKPELYAQYVEKAAAIIERFGGRYIIRSIPSIQSLGIGLRAG
jgi:uncharacterized protein (DUF1330 family)